MLYIIFLHQGGNATENFRISLGHRKTMGTSIGVDYESVSGSFTTRKKLEKLNYYKYKSF
jgi:hypothetical protein